MADAYLRLALLDGAFVPHGELLIHRDSQAMRYAVVVFEGVRAYLQEDGSSVRYFALDEHLDRLDRSVRALELPALVPDRAALRRLLRELLVRNDVREDCYLRLTASAPDLGTMSAPGSTSWSASLKLMGRGRSLARQAALAVSISAWHKPTERMFPQHVKSISNYNGPRLALLQARRDGFDDTILTTGEGRLAEAPTANLFLVRDGMLLTPRPEDGILLGVTRGVVLRMAAELGLPTHERELFPQDAYAADEAFLCGTGLEFASIASFDRRPVRGRATTAALVARYFRCVRSVPPESPP